MAPCYSLCNLQHYTKRRMLVEAVSALCPACGLNVIHDRFSHYQSYICIYLCRNDIHAKAMMRLTRSSLPLDHTLFYTITHLILTKYSITYQRRTELPSTELLPGGKS